MYLFGPSFRYGFELIPRQHSVRRAPNFQPDSFRPDFGPRTRKNSCSRRKSEAWPGFHARINGTPGSDSYRWDGRYDLEQPGR